MWPRYFTLFHPGLLAILLANGIRRLPGPDDNSSTRRLQKRRRSKRCRNASMTCRQGYLLQVMTLHEKRASEEMSRLPEMVHAGSTNPRPATVLLQSRPQESQQSLATSPMAGKTREPGLLGQRGEKAKSEVLARRTSGLLAQPQTQSAGALQDDIAPPPLV